MTLPALSTSKLEPMAVGGGSRIMGRTWRGHKLVTVAGAA
jgi:hypothetical protein